MTDSKKFSDFRSYVVIGWPYWNKECCPHMALEAWLEQHSWNPRQDEVTVLGIDCALGEITVDDMGTVSYPKDAELQRKTFKLNRKKLEKIQDLVGDLEEAKLILCEPVLSL